MSARRGGDVLIREPDGVVGDHRRPATSPLITIVVAACAEENYVTCQSSGSFGHVRQCGARLAWVPVQMSAARSRSLGAAQTPTAVEFSFARNLNHAIHDAHHHYRAGSERRTATARRPTRNGNVVMGDACVSRMSCQCHRPRCSRGLRWFESPTTPQGRVAQRAGADHRCHLPGRRRAGRAVRRADRQARFDLEFE